MIMDINGIVHMSFEEIDFGGHEELARVLKATRRGLFSGARVRRGRSRLYTPAQIADMQSTVKIVVQLAQALSAAAA